MEKNTIYLFFPPVLDLISITDFTLYSLWIQYLLEEVSLKPTRLKKIPVQVSTGSLSVL